MKKTLLGNKDDEEDKEIGMEEDKSEENEEKRNEDHSRKSV